MEIVMVSICIIAFVAVACIAHWAKDKINRYKTKYKDLENLYETSRDLVKQQSMNIDILNKKVNDLKYKNEMLKDQLERERKYNSKANDSYIAQGDITNIKDAVDNMKKSKNVSRSKAVQYITQHSNFSPNQLNNQSTDNILDYYWYLYLMNTAITEDSKSSTSSDNSTVSDDKTDFIMVEGILYDANKVNQNGHHYSEEALKSISSNSDNNTERDQYGQITSIPNDTLINQLLYDGKSTDDNNRSNTSSTSSDSWSSDDYSSSSDSGSVGSWDSSSSSSSNYSSSSYDSGGSWSSSDYGSSSCDSGSSGGSDW
jgi:hypothetical protein